ncbi:MAG: hypothetical protein ACREV6_15950 [Clostridium sp.]|uniref:hypothetical protein n=1 Tax=Clostridium sp. TaxID=1506 RepID=UPI003D6D4E8E
MIKNKKIKCGLTILEILLVIFQILVVLLALYKDYFLIYDWIFFAINYLIAILLILLIDKNKPSKWYKVGFALAIFAINSTFLYYLGNVNTVISKSQDKQHEVIIKEYKNMKLETIRLRRRGIIFGKNVETLIASSSYKAIENGKYKIEWPNNEMSVLIYCTSEDETTDEKIYSFRGSKEGNYVNVMPSLQGKWISENDPKNYFMVNSNDIVYAKDNKLYYYNNSDVKQQGISAIIINSNTKDKPSLTLVLNSDSVIGEDCLVNKGGSITIMNISFEDSKGEIFRKSLLK